MRNILRIAMALLAVLCISVPASAQFRWGVKAGVNINSIHFDQDLSSNFSSDNRAGFTGGLTAEFTVPIIGIGVDASVMYVHRQSEIFVPGTTGSLTTVPQLTSTEGDYLEIPINLKYKLGLPALGSIVKPYAFTGPSFAFLCSKKDITEAYKNKSMSVQWNVGIGVELFRHLQIGGSYGFGVNHAFEKIGVVSGDDKVGRANCWTVTAAYLF